MDKDKIAARIRALLAKTVENGCTEDEAIEAARKAAEMLAKYNLTMDEVQAREAEIKHTRASYEDYVGDRIWKVAAAVAHLVDCRYWTSQAGVRPVQIDFMGFDHEVEIAGYLLQICKGAMEREHKRLKAEYALYTVERRRRKILPFMDGMADRLAQRIRELKPQQPTGRGLIVLKGQLIADEMKRRGIETEDSRQRRSRTDEDTYAMGRSAADRVSLNKGLARPGPTTHWIGYRK